MLFRSVSRTIGVNRLVDETVVSFTHDRMMDYFLPGLAPTGKKIVIPGTAVVTFRGSRIRHEHIYYDYASMLAQAGVIDAKTYSISGAEQAEKVLAPHKHPSNRLMTTWKPPT